LGVVAHSYFRPVTTSPLRSSNVERPGGNKNTFAHSKKTSYDPAQAKLVEQMANAVRDSFSDDYKKGARKFFGGDFSKMDEARRVALGEAHFRHMESELASLKKRFYEADSFEDQRVTFEKIEHMRARNLEILRLTYERRNDNMPLGAANDNAIKERGADFPAQNVSPATSVPLRTFQ